MLLKIDICYTLLFTIDKAYTKVTQLVRLKTNVMHTKGLYYHIRSMIKEMVSLVCLIFCLEIKASNLLIVLIINKEHLRLLF